MRFRLILASVCLVLAAAGCKTSGLPPMEVVSIVNAKSNLKGYENFQWAGSMSAVKDSGNAWVPLGFDADAEMQFLVNRELRQRGLTFAKEDPDAYVFYLIIVNMDMQEVRLKELYGQQIELDGVGQGALVIGLVDAETKRPIWVGGAKARVNIERSDEEAMAILAAAVERIFSGYTD